MNTPYSITSIQETLKKGKEKDRSLKKTSI